MSNSVLKETLGSDRSMIEGGSTIVSASSRRRAPRCPVCSRCYGGYDRPRRLPVLPRVRAPARGVPRVWREGRDGALGALGDKQVRFCLRGLGCVAVLVQ